MRGQSQPIVNGRGYFRFTPARAGTMWTGAAPTTLRSVHPRACGDNSWCRVDSGQDSGSPPRVRGQLLTWDRCASATRFTPARAGTITAARDQYRRVTVHPRACGDNALVPFGWMTFLGSPPRVRGQCGQRDSDADGYRFTPARAGTMKLRIGIVPHASVHPRACGDNSLYHQW